MPTPKRRTPHPQVLDMKLATQREPNPWQDELEGARTVTIRAAGNLAFDTREFRAKPNEPLALRFINPDAVPHNWALLQPETLSRVGQMANKLVSDPDAVVYHYVPQTDDVLVYTDIVPPQEEFTVSFRAPTQPGRYPYLCTFPGHWMVMNGVLVVE